LDALDKVATHVGLGAEARLRRQIAEIDLVIEIVSKSESVQGDQWVKLGVSDETRVALSILKGIPKFAAGILEAQAQLAAPLKYSLGMERARLQASLNAALRRVERAQFEIDSLRQLFADLLAGLESYNSAVDFVSRRKDCNLLSAKTADLLALSGDPGPIKGFVCGDGGLADRRFARGALATSIAATATGHRHYESAFEVYLARSSGNTDAASLDSIQLAIELWDSAINAPIDALAAYYAGGVKPENLASLIVQALGLGAIASRL
jgi:hypothetical protein